MRSGYCCYCCCWPSGTMHLHNQSFSIIPAWVAPPTSIYLHLCLSSCSSNLFPSSPHDSECVCVPGGGGGVVVVEAPPYAQFTMREPTWPLNLNLTQLHVCSASRLNGTVCWSIAEQLSVRRCMHTITSDSFSLLGVSDIANLLLIKYKTYSLSTVYKILTVSAIVTICCMPYSSQ